MSTLNKNIPDILDCIADLSNDEIFTSPKIANQILDTLPNKLWSDPKIRFLDPCSKTGVFLREIAKRLNQGLKKTIPNQNERVKHIFSNQIFGIAITELTSLMSRRTVYYSKWANREKSVFNKFKSEDGNIFYKSYSHQWHKNVCKNCGAKKSQYDRNSDKESYAYPFLHAKIFEDMKFDVIIGNPPYQLEDGGFGKSASPIYHKFVEQAKRLNPSYLTMIIPARWYSGGKGLDEFRKEMLSDERISQIHDFPKTADCFPGQNIRGGVCYFLWDKNYKGETRVFNYSDGKIISEKKRPLKFKEQEIFIRYNDSIKILEKVSSLNEQKFDSYVSSRKPFGLPTNYSEYNKKISDRANIKLYRFGDTGYINKNQISINKNLIDSHKVLVAKASPGGDSYPHQVISEPIIAGHNTCCTETYILIGPFKNQSICKNVVSYMKTKFFRFLMILIKNTQDVPRRVYSFIPVQDFTQEWNDKKLFAKYKITKSEIDFIETLIKPMD